MKLSEAIAILEREPDAVFEYFDWRLVFDKITDTFKQYNTKNGLATNRISGNGWKRIAKPVSWQVALEQSGENSWIVYDPPPPPFKMEGPFYILMETFSFDQLRDHGKWFLAKPEALAEKPE